MLAVIFLLLLLLILQLVVVGTWLEVSAMARSIMNCDFCDLPQFLEAIARSV
jgi:hypothetical protein